MKKYLFLCAAVLLYISCSHTDPAKKYPNMIADMEPFSIGTVKVALDQNFSSQLKETEVEVVFYPRENEIALEFSHGLNQYRQFWTQEGRERFIEAINRYKEDFANKTLVTRYNRSRAAYGRTKGRFLWKTLKLSSTYRSSPVYELGYRFRNDAPYFAICQRTAKEEGGDRQGVSESPQYSVYFIRTQGDKLAQLFDQAFLLALFEGSPEPAANQSDRDAYYSSDNTPQADEENHPEEIEIENQEWESEAAE